MSEKVANPGREKQIIKEPNGNFRIEKQCLKGKKNHWMRSIAEWKWQNTSELEEGSTETV